MLELKFKDEKAFKDENINSGSIHIIMKQLLKRIIQKKMQCSKQTII